MADRLQITNAQRARALRPLRDADAVKLARFMSSLPFYNGRSEAELESVVRAAFDRMEHWNVRTPNGLAWLVVLTDLAVRFPVFAQVLDGFRMQTSWSFDQIARMLHARGRS